MSNKKILAYKGACLTWECDSNRHMNVMYYINKYEYAGRNVISECGLKDFLGQEDHGMAVVEQTINYYKEVLEDDLIYIESSVQEVANKVVTIAHEMKNGATHQLLSTAIIKSVILDKKTRRAVVLPEDLKEKIKSF